MTTTENASPTGSSTNKLNIFWHAEKSITYTNWGITSNELEPKTADECVQMCVGGAGCEVGEPGFGTWKTVPCSSSLDYICEVPCKFSFLKKI